MGGDKSPPSTGSKNGAPNPGEWEISKLFNIIMLDVTMGLEKDQLLILFVCLHSHVAFFFLKVLFDLNSFPKLLV